jgi:hypothetical protein
MSLPTRPYIAALLSLLLLLSGPVSAMSQAMSLSSDSGSSDCGTMMMEQADSMDQQTVPGSQCPDSSGVACLSSGGMSQCVIVIALGLSHSLLLPDVGSHSTHALLGIEYQNPYLAAVTPPPEHHS